MSRSRQDHWEQLGRVLGVLSQQGTVTRGDLESATGLARGTIAQIINELRDARIVVQAGSGASIGGRRPERVAFHARAGVLLSADIGANHINAAVASLSQQLLKKRSWPVNLGEGPQSVLERLITEFLSMLEEADLTAADVRGVGIGAPGPVDFATGTMVRPPIMPGWDGVALPAPFSQIFDAEVRVDNDVNVMAIGEYQARQLVEGSLLFIKIATGIGCGIILDGSVHRGADGAAGDIGHIRVPHDGNVSCTCGNTNCLEAVASGSAIARQLRARGIQASSTADVVALAQGGNRLATELVRGAGEQVGEVLAMLVNVFNPSQIIIGGALAQLRHDVLAAVRSVVYQRALPLATRRLIIDTSSPRPLLGVSGALVLAAEGAFTRERVMSWVNSARDESYA